MSHVTNIMLSHGILEGREVKDALRALDLGDGQTFRSLTSNQEQDSLGASGSARTGDFWGGGKWPECDVWACAGNHVSYPDILVQLAALPWKNPEHVQVFVKGQDDEAWSVFMFRDGNLEIALDRSEAWETEGGMAY